MCRWGYFCRVESIRARSRRSPPSRVARACVRLGWDSTKKNSTNRTTLRASQKRLGTEHTTLRLSGAGMLADIDHVFAAMDQPTVDGFNTFFVSRAAKRAGLTVALSGLGGDELFGGYASFRDVPIAARASRFVRHLRFLRRAVSKLLKIPGRRGVKLRELVRRSPDLVGSYLLRRELLLPEERRALFDRPASSDETTGLPRDVVAELENRASGNDSRNAVSLLEISSYMRDMLLRDGDVFSMSVGLELRVPLLDHEVVDLATSLPGKWKKVMVVSSRC